MVLFINPFFTQAEIVDETDQYEDVVKKLKVSHARKKSLLLRSMSGGGLLRGTSRVDTTLDIVPEFTERSPLIQ